eukprot:5584513-Karenia_brevis.AAC.1
MLEVAATQLEGEQQLVFQTLLKKVCGVLEADAKAAGKPPVTPPRSWFSTSSVFAQQSMDAAFNAANGRPSGTLAEHLATPFTVLPDAAAGVSSFAGQARTQPAFPLPDTPAVFNGSSASLNAKKRSASSGDLATSGYTLNS